MDKIRVEVSGSLIPIIVQQETNNIQNVISKLRDNDKKLPPVHIIDNMKLKKNQCKIILNEEYIKTIILKKEDKLEEFAKKLRKIIDKKYKE